MQSVDGLILVLQLRAELHAELAEAPKVLQQNLHC